MVSNKIFIKIQIIDFTEVGNIHLAVEEEGNSLAVVEGEDNILVVGEGWRNTVGFVAEVYRTSLIGI